MNIPYMCSKIFNRTQITLLQPPQFCTEIILMRRKALHTDFYIDLLCIHVVEFQVEEHQPYSVESHLQTAVEQTPRLLVHTEIPCWIHQHVSWCWKWSTTSHTKLCVSVFSFSECQCLYWVCQASDFFPLWPWYLQLLTTPVTRTPSAAGTKRAFPSASSVTMTTTVAMALTSQWNVVSASLHSFVSILLLPLSYLSFSFSFFIFSHSLIFWHLAFSLSTPAPPLSFLHGLWLEECAVSTFACSVTKGSSHVSQPNAPNWVCFHFFIFLFLGSSSWKLSCP